MAVGIWEEKKITELIDKRIVASLSSRPSLVNMTEGSQSESNHNLEVGKIIEIAVKKSVEACLEAMKNLVKDMVPKLVSGEITKRIGGGEKSDIRDESMKEGEWGSPEESPHKKEERKKRNAN